ncbi:hypothetical protein ACVW00_004263 [Marmoricola sp. URHA0025 HA25]
MSTLKRVARLAAGAILVTGIFAGSAAPAGAAADASSSHVHMVLMDTGWGG